MNLINKEFREVGSGIVHKIIDVYQNIAITNEREKIDVRRLLDTKYYIQSGLEISVEKPTDKKFEIKMDDYIDPNRFLNNERTYTMFAEAIKSIPEDKIPRGEDEIEMPQVSMPIATNESAIIVDNTYDEKEELMRKYGINNQNQDLESHNRKFEKFLTDEPEVQNQPSQRYSQVEQVVPSQVHHPIKEDPILTMFKNVKKIVGFKIQLEIDNKIPRLDFIEMMEDSYETSIIEFFAEEFTNQLIKNPDLIKSKISGEIRKMVYGEEIKVEKKTIKKNLPKSPSVKKNNRKEVNSANKSVNASPPPPPPPPDRIIVEGEEPTPPKIKELDDK
jgi:hypothetical protein